MTGSDSATRHVSNLRIGIHSGQLHGDYETCLRLALEAEGMGYNWISVVDHFRPHVYSSSQPCFEGTSILSAIAAETTRIRLGLLVSPFTWRHPAILANVASTIDHVSQGRMELGLGAAGPDRAYSQYGIPFPDLTTRLEILDEGCEIVRRLWTATESTFDGKHFELRAATLEPKPVQAHLPIIVGGESASIQRIAARHADTWNALAHSPERYADLLNQLCRTCDSVGRQIGHLRQSVTFRAVLARSAELAVERANYQFANAPRQVRDEILFVGRPNELQTELCKYREMGVDDFLLAVAQPIDWVTIEMFASEVAPSLRNSKPSAL